MGSELEKFIKDNPGVFDEGGLPEGHQQRFLEKLETAQDAVTIKRKHFPFIKAAGIAGLVASVVLLLLLMDRSEKGGESDQFAEAAAYFSYELRNTAEEVRKLAGLLDPHHRQEIMEDIDMLSELPLEGVPGEYVDEEDRIGILYENYEARVNSLKMIENSIAGIYEPDENTQL